MAHVVGCCTCAHLNSKSASDARSSSSAGGPYLTRCAPTIYIASVASTRGLNAKEVFGRALPEHLAAVACIFHERSLQANGLSWCRILRKREADLIGRTEIGSMFFWMGTSDGLSLRECSESRNESIVTLFWRS